MKKALKFIGALLTIIGLIIGWLIWGFQFPLIMGIILTGQTIYMIAILGKE